MATPDTARAADTRRWVTVLRPAIGHPSRRVLVAPHAGAGPNALAPLWTMLEPDVEVAGITLPGRERRFDEIASLVQVDAQQAIDAVVRDMAQLPRVPTVLFGHSMGAALGAAVAAARPDLFDSVVLSAYPSAGSTAQRAGRWRHDELRNIIAIADGTPVEVMANLAWRETLLELLRHDLTMSARIAHRPFPTLPLPLTVIQGSQDRMLAPLERSTWLTRTSAGLVTRTLPGGHFYLLDDRSRGQVAQLMLGADAVVTQTRLTA